jgi:hypothetical protein
MAFTTRTAQPRELGFDTIAVLNDANASDLAAAGFAFAVRYVENFTTAEFERLTNAGLGVMLTGFARTHGWSAETGTEDGQRLAVSALALGFPPDATLWNDQEDGVPSELIASAYATAWWLAAAREGVRDPGLYVGAGSGFEDPNVLHKSVPFRHYWRSFSDVPNVAVRGYQMIQLFPPNDLVAGVRIDGNVVQSDYLRGLPVLAIAA